MSQEDAGEPGREEERHQKRSEERTGQRWPWLAAPLDWTREAGAILTWTWAVAFEQVQPKACVGHGPQCVTSMVKLL